jgi:hypothetical protein
MQQGDRDDFFKGLRTLETATKRGLTTDQRELYWSTLVEYPWSVVRQGIWYAIREWKAGEGRKSFPMPGDLQPFVQRAAKDAAFTRPTRATVTGRAEPWRWDCERCHDTGLVGTEHGLYMLYRPCTCTRAMPWHARCRREGAWA